MGIFDKVKKTTIESRRYEEKLYEVALEEVEAGEVRKGLYAKALSKADGDKEKADGIYLKLRVQSIMDDIESEQIYRKESDRVLQTVQSLENKNTINSNLEDLKYDCKQILSQKGYVLHSPIFGDYWVGSIMKKKRNYYSNNDLNKIKEWAKNAKNLLK